MAVGPLIVRRHQAGVGQQCRPARGRTQIALIWMVAELLDPFSRPAHNGDSVSVLLDLGRHSASH